jgi:hypothetical protein
VENVLDAVKRVYASLYNDRAIAYRVHKGFAHADVSISAGVQRMVRSDLGAAGVMFTMDTESGFRDVVFITSSYGLGEDGRAGRRSIPTSSTFPRCAPRRATPPSSGARSAEGDQARVHGGGARGQVRRGAGR